MATIAQWDINNVCNLNCKHCRVSEKNDKKQLSLKQAKELLAQLWYTGTTKLNLSGGEPFMRDDLFEILEYSRKFEDIVITTNGTLIDEKVCEQLSKFPNIKLSISLDGMAETHDSFRRKKGTFRKVIDTLALLKEYNIPYAIKYTLSTETVKDVIEVINLIASKGAKEFNIRRVLVAGHADKDMLISNEEYKETIRKVIAECNRLNINFRTGDPLLVPIFPEIFGIDIKNDEGRITYDMQISAVQEIGSGIRYVQDMEALIEKCKEKNIYLIARIVAFKDPFLATVKPQWCVHNKDGSVFQDKSGLAWLNPYEPQVWEYLLDVAEEALRIGFDEVQFDYIRFSTDKGMENVDFGRVGEEKDREEIIGEFVKFASEQVHEAGGAISADVYGMVIDSKIDQEIVGQNYVEMSRYLDYISPMVYPSHYGPYNYNIPVPDAEPYKLVLTALQASKKALAGVLEKTVSGNEGLEYSVEEIAELVPMEGIQAQVRPWLQDFTATWVKGHINYGPEEIRAQIQAVYDAGYEEWILWNASNRYTEDGLLKED